MSLDKVIVYRYNMHGNPAKGPILGFFRKKPYKERNVRT